MVKSSKYGTRTVYVVREGMQGGYMPNALSFFASKRAAMGYMVNLKQSALDDGYTVSGSARDGYYELMPSDASDYTLGDCIVLDSVNAGMYDVNLDAEFSSFGDLIQHLNDNFS